MCYVLMMYAMSVLKFPWARPRKAICLHESIMGYRDKVFPSAAAAPLPQTDFADAGACTNIAPNVLLASGTLRK